MMTHGHGEFGDIKPIHVAIVDPTTSDDNARTRAEWKACRERGHTSQSESNRRFSSSNRRCNGRSTRSGKAFSLQPQQQPQQQTHYQQQQGEHLVLRGSILEQFAAAPWWPPNSEHCRSAATMGMYSVWHSSRRF